MILSRTSIAALLLSLSSPQAVQSTSSLRGADGTTKEQAHHRHLFEFDNPACGNAEYSTHHTTSHQTGTIGAKTMAGVSVSTNHSRLFSMR
eukprot:scaffold10953_cov108-Skeletonema_dohrnii-CCMP3373.AAC.10